MPLISIKDLSSIVRNTYLTSTSKEIQSQGAIGSGLYSSYEKIHADNIALSHVSVCPSYRLLSAAWI